MAEPVTFSVPDISCQHCVDAITSEVAEVDGVTDLAIDLDARTVVVVGGKEASIIAAIDQAGYEVA